MSDGSGTPPVPLSQAEAPPHGVAAGHGPARREVVIRNLLGLHLRPADMFVRLAHAYQSDIRVCHEGQEYNGRSILDLTSLAAECGTRIEIVARGPDAEAALAALVDLVLARFHEEDEGPSGEVAS